MEIQNLLSELLYKAVRSGGAGGQHVNKVSSKVLLSFDIGNSKGLSVEEKILLEQKIGYRLTTDKQLLLSCDQERSQLKNKAIVTKRFLDIVTAALVVPKIRKATKIPKAAIKKRIKDKKSISERKELRKRPDL